MRTIYSIAISRKGAVITLRYHGDGFMYKMVRLMTGALVKIGQGRAAVESIAGLSGRKAGKCALRRRRKGCILRG